MGGVGKFIWNSETKQFLGRTGRSWCDIGAYYFFYYTALTAFYAASICLFYQLIEPSEPRLRMAEAVHEGHPGMGFRPHFQALHTTLIHRSKKMQEHNKKNIEDYLKNEGYDVNAVTSISASDFIHTCPKSGVCNYEIFERDMGNCTKKENYGYTYDDESGNHGTPCVMLKLNKLFDWKPKLHNGAQKDFEQGQNSLPSRFYENFIPVSCHGESAVDKENILGIKYYPVQGFEVNGFFPYRRQIYPVKYTSPVIFAQIKTTPGVVVYVECRAFAENIEYNGDSQEARKGSVHFELLADE